MQEQIEVTVSKKKFRKNVEYLKELVSPSKLCIVLKSDAYGHNLREMAPIAAEAGADYVAICSNREAYNVRDLGIDLPMMRLRVALPEEIEEAIEWGVEEAVGSLDNAHLISDIANRNGVKIPVHIELDIGMGRSGFFPDQIEQIREVTELDGLKIVGIWSHFPSTDIADLTPTVEQQQLFDETLKKLDGILGKDVIVHVSNSAHTVRMTNRICDLVRVGAAAYGYKLTKDAYRNPSSLEPVMSAKTKVALVREVPKGKTIGYNSTYTTPSRKLIATIPIGFGDGYHRSLANLGEVLIHGKVCKVVGKVSLNITTVDVTDLEEDVKVGDEVVLFGKQGENEIVFEEMADLAGSVHTAFNLMLGKFATKVHYEE